MTKNWIAVASAEHVRLGRAAGFMQVNHGKAAPLKRIHPGDCVIYYSPTEVYGEKTPLRAFTALGIVKIDDPYQGEMGAGFSPFRRDVDWLPSKETPIALLLDGLAFTKGKRNWGYALRFGLLEISQDDAKIIGEAMAP